MSSLLSWERGFPWCVIEYCSSYSCNIRIKHCLILCDFECYLVGLEGLSRSWWFATCYSLQLCLTRSLGGQTLLQTLSTSGSKSTRTAGTCSPSESATRNEYVCGSESRRAVYCDEHGIHNSDDTLNTYLKVDRRKALRADLVKEFGTERDICFPPMFSNLFGKGRFILCKCPTDARHVDHRSPAHKYPTDYKQRIKRLFC